MKIAHNMSLPELAARIGMDVESPNRHYVRRMRELLAAQFDGQDTTDIPEAVWFRMIEAATDGIYVLYECGICDALHPWNFNGDCREDTARIGGISDVAVVGRSPNMGRTAGG